MYVSDIYYSLHMKISRYISRFLIFLSLALAIFSSSLILNWAEWAFMNWVYICLIIFIECCVIFMIIYVFYDKPISKLEFTIKKFLVGSLKDEDISFHKSLNPHLNYILLFFTKTLNTLKNLKSEFIHGKEIKSEVELGREIQDKLLNKKIPEIPHLEIVAKSKPAAEIGWDSYDVFKQWDHHYIYVGDATGHGVGAWFIMMMVNALVSGYAKVTHKWNHILALTNDIIKPRVKANLLMSMLMLRWDSKNQRMFMTWAWHEYLIVYKYKEKKCFRIKSWGVALGMAKNIHKILKEQEISFEQNDVIVLYSDGITEAINKPTKDGSESMFGENMLIRAIEDAPNIGIAQIKTARSIFKNISISLSKFMGYKHVQLDDITLATIQYISPEYNKDEDCSIETEDDFITEWKW